MSELKTQIGQLVTADLEDNTLTFDVGKNIIAQAGKYAIVPIAEYEKIQQANGVDKSTDPASHIQNVMRSAFKEAFEHWNNCKTDAEIGNWLYAKSKGITPNVEHKNSTGIFPQNLIRVLI